MSKAKPLRVLIVEDSEDDAQLEMEKLKHSGYAPRFQRVETAAAMKKALEKKQWDVVISDHLLPHFSSYEALEVLKRSGLDLPFIVVSGMIGEERAVELMKAGAHDYTLKDNLTRLATAIDRELKDAEVRRMRKKVEEQLQISEKRFKDLANFLPQTILEIDSAGNVIFSNRQGFQYFGYTQKDVDRGLCISQLFTPEDREIVTRSIFSGEESGGTEYRALRKNGSIFPVVVYTNAITSEDKTSDLICLIVDISERKEREQRLMVTDRLASVGELASGVAHEINNPLTAIIGFSTLLLRREKLPADIKEDLGVISQEAYRASTVVKNLLTFSRQHPEERQRVDLKEVIQRVLELRAHERKLNNIRVVTHFARELPRIMANGFQLQQVFFNIIINAEYFMVEAHNKGTLTITAECTGDKFKISFADDGPGIRAEDIKRIFDPFFTTKGVGKGTGLGLSICHNIVTGHGGTIYAKSEVGKGAIFIVELPVH